MTIWMNQANSARIDDGAIESCVRFERISHRHQGECPVRSHASRTRGRLRSRATAASRRKAKSINGAHRRGRHSFASPGF
jgi:hypothetical protein